MSQMSAAARLRRLGVVVAVVGTSSALSIAMLATAPPAAAATSAYCSEHPPGDTEACIAALSRDGVPITTGDPDWVASIAQVPATGNVLWGVAAATSPYSLPLTEQAHTWSATINTRGETPRLSQASGQDVSISRASSFGEHFTTITGRPILRTQGCDQTSWPWVCPSIATSQFVDFSGHITDYRTWTNAKQRAAFYGSDLVSNIDATDFPPQIVGNRLIINLANSHYLADGTTLATGFLRMRLPYALLAKVFGVADPASLASGGVAVDLGGLGGGTASIGPSGDGALIVDIVGLTFSTRKVVVKRASTFVGKPGGLRARRIDGTRGRLAFPAPRTRGLRIVRYQARCASSRGTVVAATSRRAAVAIGGLTSGLAYTCRVRAIAKTRTAWFESAWSAPVRMPRRR